MVYISLPSFAFYRVLWEDWFYLSLAKLICLTQRPFTFLQQPQKDKIPFEDWYLPYVTDLYGSDSEIPLKSQAGFSDEGALFTHEYRCNKQLWSCRYKDVSQYGSLSPGDNPSGRQWKWWHLANESPPSGNISAAKMKKNKYKIPTSAQF